jgi:cellulose biosynthesis protein BcsQ
VNIVAIYNLKGGVGKTTTAVNLAFLSAADGRPSLLWDLDPQGAACFYFRVQPKIKGGGRKLIRGKLRLEKLLRGSDFDGLDLLPADFSYRKLDLALDRVGRPRRQLGRLLDPLRKRYEVVFLDCPPGVSLLADAIFSAADVLLVPTIPTPLSLRSLQQLERHLRKKGRDGPAVLPFFSMVDGRKGLHRVTTGSPVELPFTFLETHIPYSSVVEQMAVRRAPLPCFAAGSRASRAFEELWRELREKLG